MIRARCERTSPRPIPVRLGEVDEWGLFSGCAYQREKSYLFRRIDLGSVLVEKEIRRKVFVDSNSLTTSPVVIDVEIRYYDPHTGHAVNMDLFFV